MKTAIALLLIACASTSALAAGETDGFVGSYENKGAYNQAVKITSAGRDRYKGAFEVATRGCVGSVTLTGKPVGKDALAFTGDCKINVSYAPDRRSIKVTHEYCGFSGAACDFNGTIRRVGK